MKEFIFWIMVLIVLKSIIIGSNFSIIKWLKYRGKYWSWYTRRNEETYEDFADSVSKKFRAEDIGKEVFISSSKNSIPLGIVRSFDNNTNVVYVSPKSRPNKKPVAYKYKDVVIHEEEGNI